MRSCNYNELIRTTIECAIANQNDWSQGIHFFLKTLGMEALLSQRSPASPQKYKKIAKKISRNMYFRHLMNSDSRKLSYLRTELQEKYSLRSYITNIENPLHRSTITKLRTHSHCLLQESHTYLTARRFAKTVTPIP